MIAVHARTRIHWMLGRPVSQVKMPALLNTHFAANGDEQVLVPMEVAPGLLDAAVALYAGASNVHGLLCTLPHKAALSRHLPACSDRSALLGMVNVVRKEGGRLVGDILDGDGVVGALGARGVPVADTEVAIVGCGGLGSAAAYALLVAGARCLHLVDTDGRRAEALAAALGQRFGRGRTLHARQAPADVGIVINASPVGMNGGDISPMPLPPEPCWLAVVDAAGSACAPLQVFARRHGITLVDGDEIARAQMPLLLDFWTFDKPEDASS